MSLSHFLTHSFGSVYRVPCTGMSPTQWGFRDGGYQPEDGHREKQLKGQLFSPDLPYHQGRVFRRNSKTEKLQTSGKVAKAKQEVILQMESGWTYAREGGKPVQSHHVSRPCPLWCQVTKSSSRLRHRCYSCNKNRKP